MKFLRKGYTLSSSRLVWFCLFVIFSLMFAFAIYIHMGRDGLDVRILILSLGLAVCFFGGRFLAPPRVMFNPHGISVHNIYETTQFRWEDTGRVGIGYDPNPYPGLFGFVLRRVLPRPKSVFIEILESFPTRFEHGSKFMSGSHLVIPYCKPRKLKKIARIMQAFRHQTALQSAQLK